MSWAAASSGRPRSATAPRASHRVMAHLHVGSAEDEEVLARQERVLGDGHIARLFHLGLYLLRGDARRARRTFGRVEAEIDDCDLRARIERFAQIPEVVRPG